MIYYRLGDLLHAFRMNDIDILVHGCNCFCTMGAGIAKQIKEKYPMAFAADLLTESGGRNKLGTYSIADYGNQHIINAYTQYTYWNKGDMLYYDAVERVCNKIITDFPDPAIRFGFPFIGCGLAGGSWKIIYNILDKCFVNRSVYVYALNKRILDDMVKEII